MKSILRALLRLARRLLGTEQILQAQRQQLDYQRRSFGELKQQLLKANSLLKYSLVDPERVRASATYKRCAELISLLMPMDVAGGSYVRVGRPFDGGYVMLDNFSGNSVAAAYSFGISNDVSWDEAIAARGIDVFLFDHTIDALPRQNPRLHFFKLGVSGYKSEKNLATLGSLVKKNSPTASTNLIMKMDVEGCEWDVFSEAPSAVIGQFSQIVLELHGLCPAAPDQQYVAIVNVLKKINLTHQCVHVHANTNSDRLWIADLVLPELLEVTYVRRSDFQNKLVANTRRFPTEIDQPTFENLPDFELDSFSAVAGGQAGAL